MSDTFQFKLEAGLLKRHAVITYLDVLFASCTEDEVEAEVEVDNRCLWNEGGLVTIDED